MPAGRPPVFKTDNDLKEKIQGYYEEIKEKKENPTITGLALFLGFESRQSIYDYEKKGKFSYTIKRARLKIENAYEQGLHGTASTGCIFALKNFGWTDRQDINTTNTTYNVELSKDEVSDLNKELEDEC